MSVDFGEHKKIVIGQAVVNELGKFIHCQVGCTTMALVAVVDVTWDWWLAINITSRRIRNNLVSITINDILVTYWYS